MTEKISLATLFLIALISSILTEVHHSNVYLSPISVKCEASGNVVTSYKCKKVPITTRDGKVSSLLVEVTLSKPLYVAKTDVEIDHKFFTPFFMPLIKTQLEACMILNATEYHGGISSAVDFFLRFMPSVPREYIHACPYQGFNRFNLTFNFHDIIADRVTQFFIGPVKIRLVVHDDDEKIFQIEVEIEPIEVQ